MGQLKDLSNQTFGNLRVIKRSDKPPGNGGSVFWDCYCLVCGQEKPIISYCIQFRSQSCGCLKGSKKHGISKHPIYDSWWGMKDRCLNPKNPNYHNYGGRGITICKEWLKNVMSFYNWSIENGWKKGLTIDRIDVNGNYEPSNCCWSTMKKQASNRQNTIRVVIEGKEYCLKEAHRKFSNTKLSYNQVLLRLRKGWDAYKALTFVNID